MKTMLTSEAPRPCYVHQDRPAVFVRIEERIKPIPQTRRIRQCKECADRRERRDDGLVSSQLVQL